MHATNIYVLVIIFILITFNSVSQDVVINEFSSRNSSGIQDSDGDYSDWIELYNASDNTINLINYRISDNSSDLNKWFLPNVTISPNEFLILFASDKNRTDLDELHTNFKISSSGEELFLSNNFGVLVDSTAPIELNSNESYGRIPTEVQAGWT